MASFVNMPDSIIPKFREFDVDSKSFIKIQEIVAQVFIMWRINIASDKLDIGIKRYPRINHKSLRYMQETLDLIQNEIGFTEEKIRSQIYLLHTDAENTRALLQLDQIGGYKPVDILKVYPKIMTYPVENIIKINQIFKEYNFPLTSVSKVMDIYTLSPESIRERLNLIQKVPQFNLLIDHPSILKLALYQKKVKHRLKVLEEHKMKNTSIHLLFANDNVFDKYIEEGADRTRGDDSLYFLSKELSVDKKDLRAILNRHPYWYHVSALVISENLKYLYSKNFTKEEILKSIFVLLYPKSVIEKELLYLKNQPGIETCLTADKKEIRKETVLPLVLYFMEQPHNFSGAGIWTNQKLPQI
uniref:Uncharacterized protein n=1 Tax=Clastoptera arizonana TaxID=38151 RepID=A0A1B6CTF5_9HEMI